MLNKEQKKELEKIGYVANDFTLALYPEDFKKSHTWENVLRICGITDDSDGVQFAIVGVINRDIQNI